MSYQDITGFETHDISANDDYDAPRTDLADILNSDGEGYETDNQTDTTIETTRLPGEYDDEDQDAQN